VRLSTASANPKGRLWLVAPAFFEVAGRTLGDAEAAMAPDESYDPRTWRAGIDYSRAAPRFPPVGSDRASRGALVLSAAILLGGAALAYAARSDSPPAVSAAEG
jgi:hypothetical protein